MAQEHIKAIGLLTESDIALLGPAFSRLLPLDGTPDFAALLAAIDEADARLRARGEQDISEK